MLGDCHIHMILDGVYYRDAIDHQRDKADIKLMRSRLSSYANAGIRFLRDGGDAWGVGKSAAHLAQEYGISYQTPCFPIYKKGHYGSFIGKGFDDMREYAQLVRLASSQGADFIKIMISGLMDFEHYGFITSEALTPCEIKEMVHIAHQEGFSVMAHANGAACIKHALEAGVDSIEHGAYMDDCALSMLSQSKAVWTPTLVTIGNLIGEGRYPDSVLRPLLELQQKNVRKCAAMGGSIALGSDAGAYKVLHAQGTLDEYALLKQALGDKTDCILKRGEQSIRERFVRGGLSTPAAQAL